MFKPVIKYLDEPMRVLSLPLPLLILYVIPVFAGILLDSYMAVPGLGAATVAIIRRYTKRMPKFYLARLMYWYLPTKGLNRALKANLPPSHQRLYIR